jgi:phosphoserine phosphatase
MLNDSITGNRHMSILDDPAVAAFLAAYRGRSGSPRPVAVFDCDGTVIQGDIGEAMFYRQIEHFHFRRSPASVWPDHPLRGEIGALFDALAPLLPRERSLSPSFGRFATILLSWYFDQIAAGAVTKACADIVRLFAGYTPGEVRALAQETFDEEFASPFGTRRLGGRDLPRGARYIRESVDILEALIALQFEIWAVSGSNAWSVEPVFRRFGVPPGRVIGIELEVRGGVLAESTAGPVPIRAGKIDAMNARGVRTPVLAASDSKNDIPLLLASSGLRIRINSHGRDTAEFFRSGGITPDASWVLVELPHIME